MLLAPVVLARERVIAIGRVGVAGGIAIERIGAGGRVFGAKVVMQRVSTIGSVAIAGGVTEERTTP